MVINFFKVIYQIPIHSIWYMNKCINIFFIIITKYIFISSKGVGYKIQNFSLMVTGMVASESLKITEFLLIF